MYTFSSHWPCISCAFLSMTHRTNLKGTMSSQAETELLKPINLELQVKRNLSSTWFSKIPGLEVQGVLKAMNVSFYT